MEAITRVEPVGKKWALLREMKKFKYIYLMLVPVLAYYIIFKYLPIYGIQLAFKDFSIAKGITGSEFVGLQHFDRLFSEPDFLRALRNTLVVSMMKIVLTFPIPVILAIMLNEICFKRYKKWMQIIYTFPHFLSWVILAGIMFNLLSSEGAINNLMALMGLQKYDFLTNTGTFRYLLVFSDGWKESGWGTIIYIATITGIDPSLYEAAQIDGANRWQKIQHIIWPGMKAVVITMLILRFGRSMEAGFMQVFNMYNPTVYSVADILDTYVYRATFEQIPDFGYSTAIGLFKAIINFGMLMFANFIAKRLGQKGVV